VASMCDWEWESFDSFVNSGGFTFSDPGPLHAPINKFTLKRDADLQLILETVSGQDAISSATSHPPGTVRTNTDTATLSSVGGITTFTLTGVQPLGHIRSISHSDEPGNVQEKSSIHEITGHTQNPNEAKYVIDWLANVEGRFHWPDITDKSIVTAKNFTIRGGDIAQTLTHTSQQGGGSRNCVRMNVEGNEIFLCASNSQSAKEIKKPGFILYVGTPTEEFREKIRVSLSYSLVIYLVHLGHSSFCKDWDLVSFKAISAYALDGRVFELPPTPPAPLGLKMEWEIDRDILSRMVNSICTHYEELNFRSLNWAFWHALCATPDIAAVHYGAAIEALQRAYVEHNPDTYQTTLLCREHWDILKRAASTAVTTLPINDQTKRILLNKISNLNSKPPSVLLDELLSKLDLTLSEIEQAAWQHRNDAGHGNYTKPDEATRLIRETKLLRLRFNRMVFAITKASDTYYDYYTFGRPTRKLRDSIP
jgi:hypothetical protein